MTVMRIGGETPEMLGHVVSSVKTFTSGTGVPPVNHAQDARATLKLHRHRLSIAARKREGWSDSARRARLGAKSPAR